MEVRSSEVMNMEWKNGWMNEKGIEMEEMEEKTDMIKATEKVIQNF